MSIGDVTNSTLFWIGAVHVALYYAANLLMVLTSSFELWRIRRSDRSLTVAGALASSRLPGISVLVPAYNEEVGILRTVRSLLSVRYPDLEVIVVNDGSSDRTLVRIWDAFELEPANRLPVSNLPTEGVRGVFRSRIAPRLWVVDKRNGGKADALNCGIGFSAKELVCVIDADVALDTDAFVHLALPFLEDPTMFATSGTIRLVNGCLVHDDGRVEPGLPKRLLERFQVLEYIRSFSIGRLFFNSVDAHVLISGAFGLFRRSALLDLGGYHSYAIGEDMELVVRAHSVLRPRGVPYRIRFVPDALLFTEAPHSLEELGRQRTRWQQGLLTSLRLHKRLILNPRFGTVGLVALPYFLFLELLSPFTELFWWAVLGARVLAGGVPASALLPLLAATTVLPALVSLAALACDALAFGHFKSAGAWLRLSFLALLEPFGYHQANLYYRLRAFPRYYGKVHLRAGWTPPQRNTNANAAT